METKIELYQCEDCEKKVSKPFGNDDTGYLCENCWNDVCARAEVRYESLKEESY